MLTLLAAGQPQNDSYIKDLIVYFKARVAADAGTFEAEECLKNQLNNL